MKRRRLFEGMAPQSEPRSLPQLQQHHQQQQQALLSRSATLQAAASESSPLKLGAAGNTFQEPRKLVPRAIGRESKSADQQVRFDITSETSDRTTTAGSFSEGASGLLGGQGIGVRQKRAPKAAQRRASGDETGSPKKRDDHDGSADDEDEDETLEDVVGLLCFCGFFPPLAHLACTSIGDYGSDSQIEQNRLRLLQPPWKRVAHYA